MTDSKVSLAELLLARLTEEFADRFERFICVQSHGKSGPAATRNSGLSHVTSKFVAFLDDDDEFLPHKLHMQIGAMEASGAVLSFSDYLRVGETSSIIDCAPKTKKYKGNLARELAFDDCRIATPTVVIEATVVQHLMPLFPEHFGLMEDNYAWLRIATTPGFSFLHISEALVKVHVTGTSVQRPPGGKSLPRIYLWPIEELEILKFANTQGLATPRFHFSRRTLVKFFARVAKFFKLTSVIL